MVERCDDAALVVYGYCVEYSMGKVFKKLMSFVKFEFPKIKISVISPTVRPEGLKQIAEALAIQDFDLKEIEWLVCSPVYPTLISAPMYRFIPDEFKGGFWSLNRAYNKLFKEAQGELIVSWQDFVWADSKALSKFWQAYKNTGGLVSGVGDQYSSLDEYGKPKNKVWDDPRKRKDSGSFYECMWNDVEWNFAAIPRELIYAVGGMDEHLDFVGFGGDQLQLCERLEDYGAKFYIDQSNESFTLRHDRSKHGGEDNWNSNHVLFNGEYNKRRDFLKRTQKWPNVEYLH